MIYKNFRNERWVYFADPLPPRSRHICVIGFGDNKYKELN
jgi:hypothetical protein